MDSWIPGPTPFKNHTDALCWVFGVTAEVFGAMDQKALKLLTGPTFGRKSGGGTLGHTSEYKKVGGDTYRYINKEAYDCCRVGLGCDYDEATDKTPLAVMILSLYNFIYHKADLQICRRVALEWIRGFVDSWIRGFVDSWIRGSTVV